MYHLSELKGMALWKQKYESLGLDVTGIEGTLLTGSPARLWITKLTGFKLMLALFAEAITAVGSFILKANELLQYVQIGNVMCCVELLCWSRVQFSII